MTQPTPSEIARYVPIISGTLPTMLTHERGDWCAYHDHLTARAADAKRIEELEAELLVTKRAMQACEPLTEQDRAFWREIAESANKSADAKEIERLRECLEPGKASAIIDSLFREAERLGHSPYSAKHAATFMVEEVDRLRAEIAALKRDIAAKAEAAAKEIAQHEDDAWERGEAGGSISVRKMAEIIQRTFEAKQ